MGKNNYPQGALDEIEPSAVREIVTSLKDLHDRGKPETDDEIEQRINDFFSFCQKSSIRPGVESLAMALHVSRVTLYNWSNGVGCSARCKELIESAKAFIGAFIEQAVLCGKISPPSGIFIMKNWLSYKDSISIEESIPISSTKKVLTADQLPQLGNIREKDAQSLPNLGDTAPYGSM